MHHPVTTYLPAGVSCILPKVISSTTASTHCIQPSSAVHLSIHFLSKPVLSTCKPASLPACHQAAAKQDKTVIAASLPANTHPTSQPDHRRRPQHTTRVCSHYTTPPTTYHHHLIARASLASAHITPRLTSLSPLTSLVNKTPPTTARPTFRRCRCAPHTATTVRAQHHLHARTPRYVTEPAIGLLES